MSEEVKLVEVDEFTKEEYQMMFEILGKVNITLDAPEYKLIVGLREKIVKLANKTN